MDIRKKPWYLLSGLFLEAVQPFQRIFPMPAQKRKLSQKPHGHKTLLGLSHALRLHPALFRQGDDLVTVQPFFQKALRQRQAHQPFAVFSQHHRNDLPDAGRQFFILSAPLAEIFSAIHLRRKIAGDGEFRKKDLPFPDQRVGMFENIHHLYDSPVRKRDVQIEKHALCFPSGTPGMRRRVGLHLLVPPLTLLHIHKDGLQHAHTGDQHRALPDGIL